MATHVLIQTVTVGSGGAASIEFTSIPQTYTDLLLKLSLRSSRASQSDDNAQISFNTSTTNFTLRQIQGDGTTVSSALNGSGSTRNIAAIPATNATANVFGSSEIYIPNYTVSNHKSWSFDYAQENNTANAYQGLGAGLWSDAAAITSISITSVFVANFVQYSSASLYGISKT